MTLRALLSNNVHFELNSHFEFIFLFLKKIVFFDALINFVKRYSNNDRALLFGRHICLCLGFAVELRDAFKGREKLFGDQDDQQIRLSHTAVLARKK